MDTSSAIRFGNREMGTLSELVSQYNVSENYTQIDFNGAPLKVSALIMRLFQILGQQRPRYSRIRICRPGRTGRQV